MSCPTYRAKFNAIVKQLEPGYTFTLDDACDWFKTKNCPSRIQIAGFVRCNPAIVRIERQPPTYQKLPEDYSL